MGYSVARSHPARDRATVLSLWERNLCTASADRYDWLYGSGAAEGWLIRPDEEGRAVGSVGLMSRIFRVRGERRRVGQAIDLNVAPEHRTVGPAITMLRTATDAARADGMAWIYGVSNPGATRVQKRLGYRVLGPLGRWVCPLRLGPALRRRVTHPWLRPLASPFFNPLLRLKTMARPRLQDSGLRLETVEVFDRRFDDLAGAYDRPTIVGERTSDYLNWRFRDGPDFEHRVFCLVQEGSGGDGRIVAYIVHHRRGPLVYIGDFFFTDPEHLELLVNEFIRRMHDDAAEAVTTVFFGDSRVQRRLLGLGFLKVPTERTVVLGALDAGQGTAARRREELLLRSPDSWFLTQADIDSDR